MEKSLVSLDKGTICSSWNYCGLRLATGSIDGTLSIFDSRHPASSSFTCTSKSRVRLPLPLSISLITPSFTYDLVGELYFSMYSWTLWSLLCKFQCTCSVLPSSFFSVWELEFKIHYRHFWVGFQYNFFLSLRTSNFDIGLAWTILSI